MMLHEHELKRAAELVARCERSLRRALTQGQTVDLIADNFCDEENEWPLEKCQEVAKSLHSTHGVGAFHMAEARNAATL